MLRHCAESEKAYDIARTYPFSLSEQHCMVWLLADYEATHIPLRHILLNPPYHLLLPVRGQERSEIDAHFAVCLCYLPQVHGRESKNVI